MTEPSGARDIWRGVVRALIEAHHAVLAEVPLGKGRVPMRSRSTARDDQPGRDQCCRRRLQADRKWSDYLDYCDRFYFAVRGNFPRELLPAGEGLIVADRFGGEIVRAGQVRPLSSSQRKAMLIRFGRAAASRLNNLLYPPI